MTIVQFDAHFDPATRVFASAAEHVDFIAGNMVHAMATATGETIVPFVEAHTPVGPGVDGHLRDTTEAEVIGHGLEQSVEIRQTKRVGQKQWALDRLLLDGHDVWSHGQPTGHHTEPHDYVGPAMDEAEAPLVAELEAIAETFMHALIEAL